MTETKNELNIYQRLHAVMKAIDYVQKEDKKVNNQYRFVSHDAVTAKCRKEFVENRVLTVPSVFSHECDGNKTILGVTVDFINIDKPEEKVTTLSFGYGIDPQDKGVGKAYSYAVKYAYLKVLGLETGDDPERDNIDFTPKTVVEKTLEKAFESPRKGIERPEQEQMYNTGLNLLQACATLEALKKVWDKNYKNWKEVLDEDLFTDIEAKKNECKNDITRENNQRNGDLV